VVDRVVGQDEALLCTLGPLAATRGRERLASSDLGVIRFRAKLHRGFERGQQRAER
jgi:hypothetical protein